MIKFLILFAFFSTSALSFDCGTVLSKILKLKSDKVFEVSKKKYIKSFSKFNENLSLKISKYLGGPFDLGVSKSYLETGLLQKTLYTSGNIFQNILSFVVPGLDSVFFFNRSRKLFRKQFLDPFYHLNADERLYLENKGMLKMFNERQQEFLSLNVIHLYKIRMRRLRELLVGIGSFYSLGLLYQNYSNTISLEEYYNEDGLKNDEIQIIVEQSPFPHLALRVSNKVYSYGVKTLNVTYFKNYYLNTETLKRKPEMAQKKSVLEKLPHSSVVATLKIDKKEKKQLISYLESYKGKYYKNETGINDCASMIVRALKKTTSINIPMLIDPSPNQVMMYLSSKKMFNDKSLKVTSIKTVATEDSSNTSLHLARNAYVSYLESKLMVATIGVRNLYRSYLNVSQENLHWNSNAQIKQVEKIINQNLNTEEENYFVQSFKDAIEDCKTNCDTNNLDQFYNIAVKDLQEKLRYEESIISDIQEDFIAREVSIRRSKQIIDTIENLSNIFISFNLSYRR